MDVNECETKPCFVTLLLSPFKISMNVCPILVTSVLTVLTLKDLLNVNVRKDILVMDLIVPVSEELCDFGMLKYVFNRNSNIFVSLDINECMNIPSPCHINATCNDTDGSYVCTCIDGYSGNGTTNCSSTFFVRVTVSFYVKELYFYVIGLYFQP